MTAPKPNTTDSELDDIITRLRAGKDPDTGEPHITETEAKDRLEALIASKVREARIDEVKLANVGRVTSKNKKSLTYMSGFGYAANNLQDHKTSRLNALQSREQDNE